MSELRSVNEADKTMTVGGSPMSNAASRETTAALAQGEAPNVQVAKAVSNNAAQEHQAAEEAARKAREVGEKLTGRPGGDVNDDAIRESLHSTKVKLDQVYPAGAGAAKDTTGKVSETAQQAAGSAKGALNTASTKATEAANSVASTASQAANFATNKASEAYNAATSTASNASNTASAKGSDAYNAAAQTASNAANTASNKGSEAYNATSATASSAANTASDKASQAGNAASQTASQTAQSASETGTGLVGAVQSTASAAVNMTGGYLASARDTAAAATNKVLETVGMGGTPASNDQGTTSSGVPAASAQLESGKHTVDAPYPSSKTTAGGGANIAEVGSTPSVRN